MAAPSQDAPWRTIAIVLAVTSALLSAALALSLFRPGGAASPSAPEEGANKATAPGQDDDTLSEHGQDEGDAAPFKKAPPSTPKRPKMVIAAGDPEPGATLPGVELTVEKTIVLEQAYAVYTNADKTSPLLGHLEPGTTVEIRALSAGFSGILWQDAAAVVTFGWIWLSPGEERASRPAAPRKKRRIEGVAHLRGTPPVMKVPAKRKEADFCKLEDIPADAVIAKDGRLKDVFVRIQKDAFKGAFLPPSAPITLKQVGCMYSPRIQGAVTGQEITVVNVDGTLHNIHPYRGTESLWGVAQPKGHEPIQKPLGDEGIYKFTCDVHPWMRAFVIVTDHPFFAVTDEDGAFVIDRVPAGKHTLEAWHSRYGRKLIHLEDTDQPIKIVFDVNDSEPEINRDELKDLF